MLPSLPVELLNRIFEELDDEKLYDLGQLCLTLNQAALTALLQRHSPYLWSGMLKLSHPAPCVIPALHRAIFLVNKDLQSMMIYFADLKRLTVELKILAEFVASLKSLDTIHFDLPTANILPGNQENLSVENIAVAFTAAFKHLLNVAMRKGCKWVTVNGSWGLDDLAKTLQPASVEVKPEGNSSVMATLAPLRQSFSKLGFLKLHKSKTQPDAAKLDSTSTSPEDNVEESALSLTRIQLCTELFFEPTLIGWTLHLCNTAPLTILQIYTHSFRNNKNWDDHLPQLQLTSLKGFILHTSLTKLDNLSVFLQRHSSTLEELTLNFSITTPIPNSTSAFSAPSQQRMEVDLPKLLKLCITPQAAPWFFNLASPQGCNFPLPRLSNIFFHSPHLIHTALAYHSDLANALTELGRLATHPQSSPAASEDSIKTLAKTGVDQARRFSVMLIDCGTVDKSTPWLKSYSPITSPISTALSCVEELTLNVGDSAVTNDEFLHALPAFLALFSGINLLIMHHMKLDQVRRLGREGYWERVRSLCPQLRFCSFFWGARLNIDQLATGKWTSQDLSVRQMLVNNV